MATFFTITETGTNNTEQDDNNNNTTLSGYNMSGTYANVGVPNSSLIAVEDFFWDLSNKYDISVLEQVYSKKFFESKRDLFNRIKGRIHYADIKYDANDNTNDYMFVDDVYAETKQAKKETMNDIINAVNEEGIMKIIYDYKTDIEMQEILQFVVNRSNLFSSRMMHGIGCMFMAQCEKQYSKKFNILLFKKYLELVEMPHNHIFIEYLVKVGDFDDELIKIIFNKRINANVIVKYLERSLFDINDVINEITNITTLLGIISKYDLTETQLDKITNKYNKRIVWQQIFNSEKVHKSYILKNSIKFPYTEILTKYTLTEEEIVSISKKGDGFWKCVIRNQNLSEDYVLNKLDKHYINYYSKIKPISINIANKYKEIIDWNQVLLRRDLTRNELEDYKDKTHEYYFNDVQFYIVEPEEHNWDLHLDEDGEDNSTTHNVVNQAMGIDNDDNFPTGAPIDIDDVNFLTGTPLDIDIDAMEDEWVAQSMELLEAAFM